MQKCVFEKESALAHIALTSYDLETGGISRVAVYLANGFCDAGHKVTLLLCTSAGDLDTDLRAQLHPDVTIIAFGASATRWRAGGQIAAFRNFRRWLILNAPDILVATSNNISWFTGLSLLLLSPPKPRLFIKTTNPIIRRADAGWLTAIRRWGYAKLFNSSQAVLTLSEAESTILRREFPEQADKFRAVFNPYLTADFVHKAQHSDALAPFRPLLLAVGRLEKQKNFDRLIRAFALARQMDADAGNGVMDRARLQIAGEGSLRGALMALAGELGQSGSIDFLGFCDDIPTLMQQADMFVLSSNYEGLPAVVIEALGCNCPVISTDCFPAARELLSGLPGCEVTLQDAESLARAILCTAKMQGKIDGLRARAYDYSLESAVASHLDAMDLTI